MEKGILKQKLEKPRHERPLFSDISWEFVTQGDG